MNSPRVLLVEDSATDAKLIVHELHRALGPVHSRRVESAESFRDAMAQEQWDIVICDWSLPEFSALAALETLQNTTLDVPLIIVSGTVGEEAAVTAMRSGARDYVLKGNLTRLSQAVAREIEEYKARQQRRQSEEALRISEARFARLYQSGVVGIAVADVLGNILEANDAYLKIVGYTREELLSGRIRWADMTPPEFRAVADEAVRSLLASGAAAPWETEQIRKDGTRAFIMVAVAMLDYPKCLAVVTDLSERRKAEVALHRTEEQLRQVQKMEAIGLLAGGVAHDFNNILSIILGYCGMIADGLSDTDPMLADIAEIKGAGERGAMLTRQLLAFSRQQVVDIKALDINVIITGLDKMLRRLIRVDVKLVTKPAANLGQCEGDPGQIEQILMNLVVNALDAMPQGGTLCIETANAEFGEEYSSTHLGIKPGHYVMLAVSDTGIGMSKDTQTRIFEPFFTTKEKGKGTGLGLSTVFGIVEQLGGAVRTYSELGHGTTLKVYLPRIAGDVRTAPATAQQERSQGTETVLVVEDEEQLRKVAVTILKRNGYHVIEASDALEALRICEQRGGIELLLTDVVMPEMNGKQLADRIAAIRPGMKVIFMSGYTDGILGAQLTSGAAFLQKPFTSTVLTRTIREVLDAA